MKLQVIALDYDGTIATDGVLDPSVRSAIAEVRSAGKAVVLATGRILEEVERLVGNLAIFDAIVAENGAVIAFPQRDQQILLGQRPPDYFFEALSRQGVPFTTGRCVVEASAADAGAVLKQIRALQLPLSIHFNRSRLMVLPDGATKATGLHAALRLLQRSEHNALAIGDAENDFPLLGACEVGVAVAWGSERLAATADLTLPGTGPPAVAEYLRRLALTVSLPEPAVNRHRLVLGNTADGDTTTLPLDGRNILIVGGARSGKSYIAGLLAEQLVVQRYTLCLIDPEGDFRTLADLPGVIAVGGDEAPPDLASLVSLLHHPELSIVIDLSRVDRIERQLYIGDLFAELATVRRMHGLPHVIAVDEVQYFLDNAAFSELLGGGRGSMVLVTYRPSDIPAGVWAECPVVIATRICEPPEIEALQAAGIEVACNSPCEPLTALELGEAVLLRGGDEDGELLEPISLSPRITSHVRHRQKYIDMPIAAGHEFVFTRQGLPTGEQATTVAELASLAERVPASVLAGHLGRGDFSRWFGEVFGDHVLAARIRALEMRTPPDQAGKAGDRLARLIRTRYLEPRDKESTVTSPSPRR